MSEKAKLSFFHKSDGNGGRLIDIDKVHFTLTAATLLAIIIGCLNVGMKIQKLNTHVSTDWMLQHEAELQNKMKELNPNLVMANVYEIHRGVK